MYRIVTQSAGDLYAAMSIQFWALLWASKGLFFYNLRSTGSKDVLYDCHALQGLSPGSVRRPLSMAGSTSPTTGGASQPYSSLSPSSPPSSAPSGCGAAFRNIRHCHHLPNHRNNYVVTTMITQESGTTTNINSTTAPLNTLHFPSIAFCNVNKVNKYKGIICHIFMLSQWSYN